MSDFAHRLKKLRTQNNCTQKQLANYMNVSQNAIYNWENDKREPSIETIAMLSDYFNVPFDWLAGLESPKRDTPFPLHENNDIIAAHFDSDEFTTEELEEIKRYAEFLKSKRP